MTARSVADVQIKVNGVDLALGAGLALASVEVSDAVQMASSFRLELRTSDASLRPALDETLLPLGAEIEIALGYVGGPMDLVLAGEVAEIEAEYELDKPPTLAVTGYDFRRRLGGATNNTTYNGMTDSAIAAEIIARNSLIPATIPTSIVNDHVTQSNESDLAFLHQRAELNGFDVLVDGRVVYFGPPLTQPVPLVFGQELLAFSPSISGADLVGKVEVRGVDLTLPTAQEFKVNYVVDFFPGTLPGLDVLDPRADVVISGPSTVERAQAEVYARARLKQSVADSLRASGRCRGNGALRAGHLVLIAGLGARFNSLYRLVSVSHFFSAERGFATTFQATGSI